MKETVFETPKQFWARISKMLHDESGKMWDKLKDQHDTGGTLTELVHDNLNPEFRFCPYCGEKL